MTPSDGPRMAGTAAANQLAGHLRPLILLILLIFTVGFVLALIVLQIVLAVLFDVPVGLEVRRHVVGEWSVLLAGVLSIALSLLAGIGFAGLPVNLAPGLGVIGVVGGCALIAGALRLRRESR